jgi:aflatoxin B1 aldehyde reductase
MNIDYPFKSLTSLTSLKCSKEVEEQQNRLILEDYLLKCCDPPPLLDTAYYYAKGQTHRSLRQLLCSFFTSTNQDDRKYQIATKVNPWYDNDFTHGRFGGLSSQQLRFQVKESLKDLGVKKVKYMFLHAYDYETPLEETLETMNELFGEGKWEEWGLSNFSLGQCQEVIRICEEKGYKKPSVYQGMYNIICRKVEELFPFLEEHDMSFWAYNPLCGGLMTGKTKQTGRFTNPIYQNIFWKEDIVRVCRNLHEFALSKGMKGGGIELALVWLRDFSLLRKGRDAILLGASTLSQFQQNWDILHQPSIQNHKKEIVEFVDNKVRNVDSDVIPSYWY